MRRIIASIALAAALAVPAAAAEPRAAPDCRFEGAREYADFGRIRTFTSDGSLYGCLTDVGRAHRLDTGTMRARSTATRRAVFGFDDWIAHPVRHERGRLRVRATNLRTGNHHGAAASGAVTALVVNPDGTLAWIAGTELWTKRGGGSSRLLGADAGIERGFLGLEKDQGCAVTWRVGDSQRSSSIHCARP